MRVVTKQEVLELLQQQSAEQLKGPVLLSVGDQETTVMGVGVFGSSLLLVGDPELMVHGAAAAEAATVDWASVKGGVNGLADAA